jgi:hypothetical protein
VIERSTMDDKLGTSSPTLQLIIANAGNSLGICVKCVESGITCRQTGNGRPVAASSQSGMSDKDTYFKQRFEIAPA